MACTIDGYQSDRGKLGNVADATVLINRSRELYDEQNNGETHDIPWDNDISILQNVGLIGLKMRYPWEEIAWIVSEEINHAGVLHKVGTYDKIISSRKKFEEQARRYHQDPGTIHPYTTDLMQVTASRQVLRFLKSLAEQRAPERVPVYEQALQASFATRFAVVSDVKEVKDAVFVNTGYKAA